MPIRLRPAHTAFLDDKSCKRLIGWVLHKKWWRIADSNRSPPACKAGALPNELIPHVNDDSLLGMALSSFKKKDLSSVSDP